MGARAHHVLSEPGASRRGRARLSHAGPRRRDRPAVPDVARNLRAAPEPPRRGPRVEARSPVARRDSRHPGGRAVRGRAAPGPRRRAAADRDHRRVGRNVMTPTVLITGASSGIGRATAQLLTERGFTVYGTARRPDRATPEQFRLLALDVRSDDSVRACVDQVLSQTGRLDLLVNNAGYALTGAAEEPTRAEAKAQFETNFFGTVRMVNAVLPGMRNAGAGRI